MAGALTSAGKAALLDSATTWPPAYLALHNVDAPADGTSELSGGSYARVAANWAAAAGGTKSLSGNHAFSVPAGATVRSVGLWTASTGGTLLGYWDVTDETFGGAGTYTLTSGSITI